jgi:hypothetical protein
MEMIWQAANTASLMVLAGGHRISRIVQSREAAMRPRLSDRLRRFYLDEVDHAVEAIVMELNCDPA